MNITVRKIFDKLFLPCFYGFCIIGIGLAVVFFSDVKKQQKEALLAYERNLNIKSPNESIQLELNDKTKEELVYTSSNEEIVKVDDSGHLISTGEGSAVVTVSTKDKKKSQVLIVNVGQDAIKEYIKNNPKDNKETADTKPVDKNTTTKDEQQTTEKPSQNEPSKNETFIVPEIPQEDNSSKTEEKQPSTPKPSTTNKTVAVTGVKLNKTSASIGINAKNKTTTLTATVSPSNATNKSVTWSSSDTSVATVKNGVVTAKGIGTATITVKTASGAKTATAKITVTKKVVIIIGASQVTRMKDYKSSYSSTNYNYNVNDDTLIYVNKSGSGHDYQTGAGFQTALNKISNYQNKKNYVTFHIYFPLVGNTIKNFSCKEISETNSTINTYASNYNTKIASLKNNGYKVKAYVVSMHPVKVSQATSNSKVVTNEHKNSCDKEYRSNIKYFTFNKAMKKIVESKYSANLEYQSLFIKIMDTSNSPKNFSYKITYNTTDGVHWDKDTTNRYVNMMLDYSNDL